ncbi:MAG: hypothetical protein ACUZ8E_17350 [Candidatus Anammoxibacter sp.]
MTIYCKEFKDNQDIKFYVFKGRKLVFCGTDALETIAKAMPLAWMGGTRVTIKRPDGTIFERLSA